MAITFDHKESGVIKLVLHGKLVANDLWLSLLLWRLDKSSGNAQAQNNLNVL